MKVGHEYVVLTLLIDAGGRLTAQILAEDGEPSCWSGGMFETADERLPENWVARLDPQGLLEFAPRAWLREGFWDDYFDDLPEAVDSYSARVGDHPGARAAGGLMRIGPVRQHRFPIPRRNLPCRTATRNCPH